MNPDTQNQNNYPLKIGERMYTEEHGGSKQSWFNYFIAKITLNIVCGWFHIIFLLFVFSFYSKIVLSIIKSFYFISNIYYSCWISIS